MKKEEEETKREEENKEKKYLSREEILILKNHSILLQDLIEDEEDDTPKVHLKLIDSKTLKKVIEYCKHHENNKADDIEKPLKGDLKDVISQWDFEFINVDQSEIVLLVMAANYLNIPELLNLACAAMASLVKGKTPKEFRDLLGIDNAITAEEEAILAEEVAEENRWCEEN